jgi:hypothetical protein
MSKEELIQFDGLVIEILPDALIKIFCWGRNVLGDLAGRDPHDVDGVADHVAGAALAFGASGHYWPRRSWSWMSLSS